MPSRKSFLCFNCNLSFDSEQAYESHKSSGHTSMKGATSNELPTGIPQSALPTPEFMERIKQMETKPVLEASQAPTPILEPKIVPEKIIPAQPIKLIYQFLGTCPDDKSPVTTVEIDAGEDHYAICICLACRKQLASQKVAKLK